MAGHFHLGFGIGDWDWGLSLGLSPQDRKSRIPNPKSQIENRKCYNLPVKILQISSARTYGGGERHFVDLCRELVARGHEVHVVLRPTNEWQAKLDFIPADRIIHASIRNAFGIFSAKKIARYVRDNAIQVVHAHAGRDYIPASLVCRMSNGVKCVLTRHVLFPMKPFHKIALRNLSKAIAVSSAVAKNLGAIFPSEKIALIPNGLDEPVLPEEKRLETREAFRFFHEIPFDVPLVGTVGELKPLKGQRDFILAAAEIAKVHPDARYVIVGRDSSVGGVFRKELRRLAKVSGIEEKTLFLDWIDDLPSLMSALDVFVSPSHSESFGLAILEALMCGVPVVSTETEGAKEMIRDRETGWLVPIGDPVVLSRAVVESLADPSQSAAIANAARTTAREEFSLIRMIDRTEEVYRGVIGR